VQGGGEVVDWDTVVVEERGYAFSKQQHGNEFLVVFFVGFGQNN
jgi:hypothetical protein